MADALNLTRDIAIAVDGAAARGEQLALGYIDDGGYPVTTFRGSTQVHGSQQLAIWARKADDGFARAIRDRQQVTLVYYGPDTPGPKYLAFRGRAHLDPSANNVVYGRMIEGERQQDPERRGVAVIIDIERVQGFRSAGPFQQERSAD